MTGPFLKSYSGLLFLFLLSRPVFADYTVTGKFQYQDREFNLNGFTGNRPARPIRFATVRIMDEAVFQRENLEEGGPKGLDIDASSKILAVTWACQPLAFFDVAVLLQQAFAGGSARARHTA